MGIDITSGATGIVVGFGLKFASDLWTAKRQDHRQDQVWRRERLTDAAAELLAAAADATKAGGWVVRCVEELGNAERAGTHPADTVMAYTSRLNEAYELNRVALDRVDQAVHPVLLYASAGCRAAALELVKVTKEKPTMQEVFGGPWHNQAAADAFRDCVIHESELDGA